MDYQVLFNAVFMVALFLGGWVLNRITSDLREIAQDHRKLDEAHQKTREEYVLKADHKNDLENLGRRFDKVDNKLDQIMELVHKR